MNRLLLISKIGPFPESGIRRRENCMTMVCRYCRMETSNFLWTVWRLLMVWHRSVTAMHCAGSFMIIRRPSPSGIWIFSDWSCMSLELSVWCIRKNAISFCGSGSIKTASYLRLDGCGSRLVAVLSQPPASLSWVEWQCFLSDENYIGFSVRAK